MHAKLRSAWAWVPSLYFAQGIPFVTVMAVSVIMFKRLGISNADIALYTSWLYLPWVIKPLWGPVIDVVKTKRWWVTSAQLIIGGSLAGVALTIPAPGFFQYTLAFFWLIAFSSATHDIAADGFYMIGLNQGQQSFFVGIRSTFYRFAMITGQGLLVVTAGSIETTTGNIPLAWSIAFGGLTLLFLTICLYHIIILPKPPDDIPLTKANVRGVARGYITSFKEFFAKKGIVVAILFLLLYRLGESQLVKLAAPFLLDDPAAGGLGLTTASVGFITGTSGIIALVMGGIAGGIAISRAGLKYWLLPMALAINLPNLIYVYLAWARPDNLIFISSVVAIEQFGYGFGFTGFIMYMIYFSRGNHKTAHYAICTGFMALGMMLPGMVSGWLQEITGYLHFFIWVVLCTIPGIILIKYLDIDPLFGMKRKRNSNGDQTIKSD